MAMRRREKFTKPMTVTTLKFLNDKGKLWLNPVYQREAVWTRSQSQLLIDSLLNGIDIPKLYFRETEGKKHQYEVVDGQQRLRAIFGYLTDDYALPDDADDVEGFVVKGRRFSTLDTDLQIGLQNQPLDVTILQNYSDDDVEEMFLRLQNGSPLNAAEKRRAMPGNIRNVVKDLANHKAITLCGFSNRRYGHEDAVAKILHLFLNNGNSDVRASSVRQTYQLHPDLADDDAAVKQVNRVLNFISKAFKGKEPAFKKFSIITVATVASELLDEYDLSQYPTQFAEAYLSFETSRAVNSDKPDDEQDPVFAAYTEAARNDSLASLEYRHNTLKRQVLQAVPRLIPLDDRRAFSSAQRVAIFHRGGKKCASCGRECVEGDWHADHIVAHSKGGKTTVANGQLLCTACNLQKGNRT